MRAYVVRRFLVALPTFLGITVLTYILINLAPGDPVEMMLNPDQAMQLGPEWVELRRHQLGLDKPIVVRYFLWLREAATGNLGYSYTDGRPVMEKLVERLGATLRLVVVAAAVSVVAGTAVGVLSALRRYSLIDYLATFLTLSSISVPTFFLALAAIYMFAVRIRWFPTSGMFTLGVPPSLTDALWHLVLPALILGMDRAGQIVRYTRSSVLECLRQDYIRTARAKGLSERVVIYRHALRNALLPVVTIIGLNIPSFIAGSVIVEQIFQWPGMGTMALTAILLRDYPVLMGFNLVIATAVLVSNMLTDLAYALVDPRIRLG